MNPNAAMANMNPMGGPVGNAPMPMMNNNSVNPQTAAAARQLHFNDSQRGTLNTYIYEYFVRYGMYDCARTLLHSDQQVNVKDSKNGNTVNGAGDDSMDTDSKEDIRSKTPDDLPAPKLPMPASDTSFLYEWFCLFWDIYNAQRSKGSGNGIVNQYVMHTQELLRGMRPEAQQAYQAQMVRSMQSNMCGMKPGNHLARAAMANNQNPQMMLHAKQNQMQRDASNMNANQDRPASPATGDNAPSPSAKRQRTDAGPVMAPQQMVNGPGAQHNQQAQQLLAAGNLNPNNLTPAQMAQFANIPQPAQQKSIAAYSNHLQQHHGNQMGAKPNMPNVGGPQNPNASMVPQAPDGTALTNFYNPSDIGGGMRPNPNGPAAAQGTGSNHALQDYQMQLMLLEQQNKKRLMMARQEQDSMGGGGMPRDGPPPGPNGQFQDTSPQAMRNGASPNPGDQMKRGTPQMNNAGIASPVPEGGPSRDSPNPAMNFMGNHVDPNMGPHFFKGVDGNMGGATQVQMNGMRPPSSHPGQPFNQQMMAARAQGQGGAQQWQPGPNGQMVNQGVGQNQQAQGAPQNRAMPPPSAPVGAAAAAANNRTTASPQQPAAAPPTPNQGTKNAPKKKETKAAKDKRTAASKKQAAASANPGATPAAEGSGDGDAGAPATPMTPSFNKNAPGAQNIAVPATTAPASAAPAVPTPAPTQDLGQNLGQDTYSMIDFPGMEFANPLNTGDVLSEFDFDSFLNENESTQDTFDFGGTFPMEGNEIGAE